MSAGRINDLPERSLVKRLQAARELALERKSSQRIGGASLAFVLSESEATFDWSGLVDGPTGNATYGMAQFIVKLTSKTAEVPLVDAAMVVYYSTDGTSWTEYTYERSMSDFNTFTPPELSYNLIELPGVANGPFEARFRVWLSARTGTRAAFKLQAIGTDEVTISVERVL